MNKKNSEEMFFTLSVLLFMPLDLRPEGMRLNICRPFSPSRCLNRQQSSSLSLDTAGGRCFELFFVTLCRFFLSATEQFASQAVTRCVWCRGKRPPTASPPLCFFAQHSGVSVGSFWAPQCCLALKERSSNTHVPSNLKGDTYFTRSLLTWEI